MACEANRIGEDDLQLIDFSEEDDYLIDFPFRDSLEDLRLSVTFDNVNERDRIKLFGGPNSQAVEWIDHVQPESVEPKRPSFLRKSLAWDSAFFNSAGVLNPEELFMINKGFKKAESNHLSPGTRKDVRPRGAPDRDHTSLDNNGFRLEALEDDLFENIKPNIPKLSKRSKLSTNSSTPAFGQANELRSKKTTICSQNKVKSVRAPKDQSLNPQGSKGVTKTRITAPQTIQDKMSHWTKLISTRQTVVGADGVKMENKTRKAGSAPDATMSKRSRWGDLSSVPKSSFTSPITEKNSKIYRSYESSSSVSSSKNSGKSIRRKTNPRNTKLTNSPSSVHFSFTSTCSSSTSPGSSIDGWLSSTSITCQNPITSFHSSIPEPGFQSHLHDGFREIEERKLTSQCATRASMGNIAFSGGPKRRIKSSGLRMPSPKIGFFDEEQPMQPNFRESTQARFGGESSSPLPNKNTLNKFHRSNLSPIDTVNCLEVGKTSNSVSCSKLKPNRRTPEDISKNKTNTERKSENEKENALSLEDEVNELSRYFELIDLERDIVSRTPLAEKTLGN